LQPVSLFERKQGIFWSEQRIHLPEQGICKVGQRHAKPHRLRAPPRSAGERLRKINDGRHFQNSKHVKAAYSELSGLSRGSDEPRRNDSGEWRSSEGRRAGEVGEMRASLPIIRRRRFL
jgi:hypothetical protein